MHMRYPLVVLYVPGSTWYQMADILTSSSLLMALRHSLYMETLSSLILL